ncbi:MAG TPA: hypothetical protein VFA68_08865 [Terriglobales bacterium]|nr:hypothetical protein [Terriglobales bacterium]
MASNNWLQLYHDVLLETDGSKLPERLKLAEAAIRTRVRELGDRENPLERKAMGYALSNLGQIQKQK